MTRLLTAFAALVAFPHAICAQLPKTIFGTVNTAPVLSIGVQDGDEELTLHRVTSAIRLPDGRIVISNSGTQQLRVFDAKGAFVKNVGGKGAGPGEFGEIASLRLFRFRDSVIALDDMARRIHVFDLQLKFAKTRLFTPVPDFPRPFTIGAFADGSLLTMAFVNGGVLRGDPGTIIRSQYALGVYGPTGTMLNKITTVEAQQRYILSFGNSTSFPYIPLIPEPLQANVGDEIFLMRGAKPELEVFNRSGKLVRTLNWPAPTTRAASLWKEYKEADLATMTGQSRGKYEKFYTLDLPLPELAPTYAQIVVDSENRLWLKRYRIGRGPSTWDVITTKGEWLGFVQTPARFALYEVYNDVLIGRQLDELDSESVQLLKWTPARK